MESTLVDIALGGIITWILFQTWMNLWPLKKGPYDPLTYDVRRTISVRIMLHGPWLEMRFPKRNLPLRRMYNDKEPSNVQFHEHVEVIDLSTCSIGRYEISFTKIFVKLILYLPIEHVDKSMTSTCS